MTFLKKSTKRNARLAGAKTKAKARGNTTHSSRIATFKQIRRIERRAINDMPIMIIELSDRRMWKTPRYEEPQNHIEYNKDGNPQDNGMASACSPYGSAWWMDDAGVRPVVVDASAACDVPLVAVSVGTDLLDADGFPFCHFGGGELDWGLGFNESCG
jgi:hypothetical protein